MKLKYYCSYDINEAQDRTDYVVSRYSDDGNHVELIRVISMPGTFEAVEEGKRLEAFGGCSERTGEAELYDYDWFDHCLMTMMRADSWSDFVLEVDAD